MLFPNSLWEDACDYRHDCVGRWLYVTDSEINNIFPFGQQKKPMEQAQTSLLFF